MDTNVADIFSDQPEMMSVKRMMTITDLSRHSIYKLIEKGDLQPVRPAKQDEVILSVQEPPKPDEDKCPKCGTALTFWIGPKRHSPNCEKEIVDGEEYNTEELPW